MTETRLDGFLGGRLQIAQPVTGYRSGADAVMLAAACPASPGQQILELGCGAGVALLCLGLRVPDLRLAGLERQEVYADLARANSLSNGISLQIWHGDLTAPPADLVSRSFDHVIANPPYFTSGTASPDQGRSGARHEDTPLAAWIDAGLRRLAPGGRLVTIQRADRLPDLLVALAGRAGDITVLPVAAREGRDAGRIIVGAKKGARGGSRLLSPLIMHAAMSHTDDRQDLTDQATGILRDTAQINLW